MLKKIALVILAVSPLAFGTAFGQSSAETVNISSGGFTITDASGSPLPGGSTANGNGDVLELGYFSTATPSSLFSGTFVPISGAGSSNTAAIAGASENLNQTSIGDTTANGAGNGTFAMALTFTVGSLTSGNNLPSVGTPLVIMFFNATTIAAATQANAVSDASWLWKTPSFPNATVNISLNDTGLVWQDGTSSAFKTQSLAPPVPAAPKWALMVAGAGLLVAARRRLGPTPLQPCASSRKYS